MVYIRNERMAGLNNLLGLRTRRMIYLLGISLLMLSGVLATVGVNAQGVVANVTQTTCKLYNTVHSVIFVVGLVLIIVGASLYAGATILPGNLKGSAQGYGMGMIVGGVVGVLLAISAPFILSAVTGNSLAGAACSSVTTTF